MKRAFNPGRRRLLRDGGLLATLGALAPLVAARAATSGDYRALVCIFLIGGNDGHNTLVPMEATAYQAYRSARGTLALSSTGHGLVTVSARDGTPYGLNGGLAALQSSWAQGQLAAVANVGMLAAPTTQAQWRAGSVPLPVNLFSHADQQLAMQAGRADGSGGTGWGGRAADALQSLNASSRFPGSVSVSGTALYTYGATVRSATLIPGFDLNPQGLAGDSAADGAARLAALRRILAVNGGLSMVTEANAVRTDALSLRDLLAGLASEPALSTVLPNTDLGQQLREVIQVIRLRDSTGMRRQVFFCTLGGFDTHSDQVDTQSARLGVLANALAAFQQALGELGLQDAVTAFTLSEFGRTLQPSGTGSDHGWGSHHLVLGGGVRGGDVYGKFPFPALGGSDDAGSRGVLIPTTSLDQYGATLARWFGADDTMLQTIFPNLAQFGVTDLGFMG